MLGRRFLLIVAVLMGLTALAASVAPRDPALRGSQAERTERAPAPTFPGGSPTLQTIQREISAHAESQRIVVHAGDLLELEVAGSETDAVALLGEVDAVAPGTNARFHILAEEPGEHPIELLEAGRRIGTLVIRRVY
jgi:hypothetical protein